MSLNDKDSHRDEPPRREAEAPSPVDAPVEGRRDFLKVAGFSLAALAIPGCSRAPTHEAVPFVDAPEDVTPGLATWFATLCAGCSAGCGVLAKYRDGRPIKVEGNPEHPLSKGGVCAVGQAGVLSLYDNKRLRMPMANEGAGTFRATTWEAVDSAIAAKLTAIEQSGRPVRFLTGTVNGPTERRAIEGFLRRFGSSGRHVSYDALSSAALLDAHERTFGRRLLPHYRFDRARVIVSFDADFLGTWISPVEFTRGYRESRSFSEGAAHFSRHVQVESRLSLTGCSADDRHVVGPNDLGPALQHLAALLGEKAGQPVGWTAKAVAALSAETLAEIAEALWQAPRGQSLVVCGSNRLADQTLTALINNLLGNYGTMDGGTTIDLEAPSNQRLGDDLALGQLVGELKAGTIAALFVSGCNPLYDLPGGAALAADLAKVGLFVSLSEHMDETAARANWVCPDHHALESWGDAEPVAGVLSLSQPVIQPLGGTRARIESLALWSGAGKQSAYDLMRKTWRTSVFSRQMRYGNFERFWTQSVHDGFARVSAPAAAGGERLPAFKPEGVTRPTSAGLAPVGSLSTVLYPKVAMLGGQHAHNPWLQELPDPISKISWDNYAAIAPATAKRLRIKQGDLLTLEAKGRSIELPALLQPGQHEGVVAVALGYGRAGTDRFAGVGPAWVESRPTVEQGGVLGTNAAALLWSEGGYRIYDGLAVTAKRTGYEKRLALAQLYGSQTVPAHLGRHEDGPRPIAQETTLAAWRKDHGAGIHKHPKTPPLWDDDHEYKGHHWGLAIDLSACTGCSACVIACQAENNIPVVGQDEVRRTREMHWLRIDRYYAGEGEDVDVVHQPMLCQQCDNAPCESVCPVLATVHSEEGLNQQVYNRCVGTRYCSNNCPYKVRRFNWFHYEREDGLQNMVLNPDVTVRSRGVMEKCTFCVQRIQEGKIQARNEHRPVADGEIKPACVQSCPAEAMVFGDMNDEKSRVADRMADPRAYRVLEELDVRPSVHYLTRVRNRAGEGASHD